MMKNRLLLIISLLFIHLCSWAQIGGEFDPQNPPDPNFDDTQKYLLTIKAAPENSGSFNTTSVNIAGGKTYNLKATPNTDFTFVAWVCNGDTLSKSSSYTYTMPYHDVEIIGLFSYSPSNPSDPDVIAKTYKLTLKAFPSEGGSFNATSVKVAADKKYTLRATPNTDYVFEAWICNDDTLSKSSPYDYIMPNHDVEIEGHFEYNPVNPDNPNKNYWNKMTGEVIVDDFTQGNLASTISNLISGSSNDEVKTIIISGIINSTDLKVVKNYKNCTIFDVSRVTGITEIPSSAFSYTNVESVFLPATIEKIGSNAFAGCSKLSSIIIYAFIPPTLGNNVFQGVSEDVMIFVPAAAIAQYQDDEAWKKFTLLPIQEDIRSITVSFPEETNILDYANMWLELINKKNGQRLHYVITERRQYTFANIICNTSWNVVLRNERGDVFGLIDNVDVYDKEVSVTFTSLSKPQNVMLTIRTPDGTDVTDQTQITWMDVHGIFLVQGASLSGLPVGYQANYRVVLSQELAMVYETPLVKEYVLKDGGNNVECKLEAIKQVQLSGKVKDTVTGMPLSGAIVSASQTFGGKYSKTLNAKTDNDGLFTMEVAAIPTSVAFAATDYISQTIDYDKGFNGLDSFAIPDVSLKSITGATIAVDFTYTTVDGKTQDWYSDYQNVSFELFNVTKNHAVSQFNVQYPQIVLLEEVDDGDVLRLTASSRVNAFKSVESTVTIADQRAETAFAIIELGQIQASFTTTDNVSVVGSLYDASKRLVKTYNYANTSLTISNLSDGQYTLVSMGGNRLFNTIYDLTQLPQTGLVEGSDYVKNTVAVKSGAVSTITIANVPKLDETKLYYTGDNTSFTVNRPNIVAGNYLTLTGHIDFKPAYATSVSNVQMIVDLPESCQFVENSVMVGNSTSSYTLNGNRITIPITHYTDRVRFCIIPTLGGNYAPSAFAQFDLSGETIMQPIGSANYTAKDLSIIVPSTVVKTSVPISGTAIGASSIDIYDNDVLIGQTVSLANGNWQATCELNEPYNRSTHEIFGKIKTPQGLVLLSETKETTYDINAIRVSKVSMYNTAHGPSSLDLLEYETVFNFLSPSTNSKTYWYWPKYPDFTFVIDFTNNNPSIMTNVQLNVKTTSDEIVVLPASYDISKNVWVATGKFLSNSLPANVSVGFNTQKDALADRIELDRRIEEYYNKRNSVIYFIDSLNVMHSDFVKDSLNASNKKQQMKQLIEEINQLLSQDIYDRDDFCTKMAQFLTLVGYPCTSEMIRNNEDIVINSDEELDAFIADLIEELQDNQSSNYYTDLDNIIIQSRQILKDDSIPLDEWLNYKFDDRMTFYDNNNQKTVFPINFSDLNLKQYDADNITYIRMTKGKPLMVISDTDGHIMIDQEKKLSWKIQTQNQSYFSSSSRKDFGAIYRASDNNNEIDVSELNNLLEQFDKFGTLYKEPYKYMQQYVYDLFKQENQLKWVIERDNQFINTNGQRVYDVARKLDKAQFTIYQRERFLRNSGLQEPVVNRLRLLLTHEKQLLDLNLTRNELMMYGYGTAYLVGLFACFYDMANNSKKLVGQVGEALGALVELRRFANSLRDCSADQADANFLADEIEMTWTEYYIRFIRDGMFSLASILWDANMITNPSKGSLREILAQDMAKMAVTPALQNAFNYNSQSSMDQALADFWNKFAGFRSQKSKLNCYTKDNLVQNVEASNNPDISVVMDPSGFVYEGVTSNRLQGVMATAYFKEMIEDMYGDLHENIVKWDAVEYSQENPLFTDEYGMYAWDVPNGLWQVKFEKEGYETTYSEWLPVPPPQFDVNISMRQARQPEVKNAKAYEDAVEVEFDKYMMPELLTTDNIIVMQGNDAIAGSVELLNNEVSYEGSSESFASKVRFNAVEPFTEQEITLMVSNHVKSYAGIRMQDDYQQKFTIEKEIKEIHCEPQIVVGYGENTTQTISVLPASASDGKTIHVKSSSPMIVSVENDSYVLDKEGKVEIKVIGELPGVASLIYTINGYDLMANTDVKVEIIPKEIIPAPLATISSGTSLYRGAQVELYTGNTDLRIWYTIDGSCPCDENGTRKEYTGPITIKEDVVIKAMAETIDGETSDVATFSYMVLKNTSGVALNEGWQWVSFNMQNDALKDVNTALSSGTWTDNDEIKSIRYADSYSQKNQKWYGTLSLYDKINNSSMYKIHSSRPQTLNITGEAVNPSNVSIGLGPNWNYISYLPLVSMSVEEALADYQAQEGDMIKSQDAFAVYSSSKGWEGNLQTLLPGEGYMMKRSDNASTTSFYYPALYSVNAEQTTKLRSYGHKYSGNMNIIGKVVYDDLVEGDSIIAIVNGEVRGRSVVNKNSLLFMTIEGDNRSDISLSIVRDGQIVSTANNQVKYENDAIIGSLSYPTEIQFILSDVDDIIKTYPNIVEDYFNVSINSNNIESVRIIIYNLNGLKVYDSYDNNLSFNQFNKSINLSNINAGIYIANIQINNESHIVRIIKK